MAYFTAVLARRGSGWRARDVDVSDADDLPELADRLRSVEDAEEPVLLVLEREDAWFALVRVDGEEDPRVFVSDASAALESPYADGLGLDPDEVDGEDAVGDLDVLADLGVSPEELAELTGDDGPAVGDALAVIGERAGFAELLDSLR